MNFTRDKDDAYEGVGNPPSRMCWSALQKIGVVALMIFGVWFVIDMKTK